MGINRLLDVRNVTIQFFFLLLLAGTFPVYSSGETFTCDGAGFEIDTPQSWIGEMSSSKTSLKIEPADTDELTLIVQAKKTNKNMSASQIIYQFKKRWKAIKTEFPKSTVVSKPGKTMVGEFAAIDYHFRYLNFINIVIDERVLWFNPSNDSLSLTAKIEIQGPGKRMKEEAATIQGIIESFRLIKEKPSNEPVTVALKVENTYTPSTTQSSNTGHSSTASSSSNPVRSAYAVPSEGTHLLKKKTFVPKQLAQKRDFKPAGLMSNARQITDPEKLEQYQKTFLDRNTERTAEQKARARQYSGGFSNAQVE